MSAKGKLYLLPVPVSDESRLEHIPAMNLSVIRSLKYFIAENAKTARAFLKLCNYESIANAEIELLNVQSKAAEVNALLDPIFKGYDIGLMSDAGCPGIADPGADLIRVAHSKNIEVVPLTGPSAIVLSIMASGFNGQNFAFCGYLPIEAPQKIRRIKELEQSARKQSQAQFFIETPYRNDSLFDSLINTLQPQTLLFVGKDLTGPDQSVQTFSIENWKKRARPVLAKIPVVFGLFC